MIAAYGPYAASATGGNDIARDVLAGVAAMYAGPCKLPIPPPQKETPLLTVLSSLPQHRYNLHTRIPIHNPRLPFRASHHPHLRLLLERSRHQGA